MPRLLWMMLCMFLVEQWITLSEVEKCTDFRWSDNHVNFFNLSHFEIESYMK